MKVAVTGASGFLGSARPPFGERTHPLLLAGTRVKPERPLASGYSSRHPDLEEALRHLLGRTAFGA